MKPIGVAVVAALALGGCANWKEQATLGAVGIDPYAQVVTKEQVLQACQITLLLYAGWEAAGHPGAKDPAVIRKIRAAYAGVERFCLMAPTTPADALKAGMSSVVVFRTELAAAKAGS